MPYPNRYVRTGKVTRYIEVKATRLSTSAQTTDPNAQAPVQSQQGQIRISLINVDKVDASTIKQDIAPNASIYTVNNKYHSPAISFTIPEAKFAKWIRVQIPKMVTILEASNNSDYKNRDELENKIMDAVHSAPSEMSIERANVSLKELEEAIYKALQANDWDTAGKLYKKAINLISRVYGHQLSPDNVRGIYAQAQKAGIDPNDKGAATNSYWPDGTEKFWPTFVRSAKTWRGWGRTIKDEPKMQYIMSSGDIQKASNDVFNNRLQGMGLDASKLGMQQRDALQANGITNNMRGVGYDISDTEGTGDFFDSLGLLNNLDGTLTPKAELDRTEWEKKIAELKAQQQQGTMDDRQKLIDAAGTDEGQAGVYLDAINKLCNGGQWTYLNITPRSTNDPIADYLLTIKDVAQAKVAKANWVNPTNIDKISQIVTAAVAISTVGSNKLKSLGFDLSNTSSVVGTFENCKSTILATADNILSTLGYATSNKSSDAPMNENNIIKRFNLLMERMNNIYNEGYNYELNEGIVHRPSDEVMQSKLEELGVVFADSNVEDEENVENQMR